MQAFGRHLPSLPPWVFDNLDEKAKGILGVRPGMDKEHCSPARTGPRRFVDQLKSIFLHGIVGCLSIRHTESEMCEASPAAVSFNQFLHG